MIKIIKPRLRNSDTSIRTCETMLKIDLVLHPVQAQLAGADCISAKGKIASTSVRNYNTKQSDDET